MNAPLPRPVDRDATRHLVTLEELLAMQAAGLFAGERTQLLDGEIHVMPTDGVRHINYTMEIAGALFRALPRERFFVGVQTTLTLSPHNAPSPDIYVLTAGPLHRRRTPPERIRLVVEVADTSLKADLVDSASRYARHGVREFWVVDAGGRRTFVHRDPVDGVYPEPREVPFDVLLAPALIEGLALRLADFDAGVSDDDEAEA